MNKFHQIPTDTFVPISHENTYLFNHYDKVANFLAFNLEKNYKNILAKPVQNNYMFDWFSVYDNLININDKNKAESEVELVKYWEFIEVINTKICQLSSSNEENSKNWANLLTKVFNHKDNFIFSNGKDICIVWGWKFDNNNNYKPNIVPKPLFNELPLDNNFNIPNDEIINKPIISDDNNDDEEEILAEEIIEDVPVQEMIEDFPQEKSNFLEFLKWFASKFWWLLLVLTTLIILVFLYKTLKFNAI